jgi:hypothetical protein
MLDGLRDSSSRQAAKSLANIPDAAPPALVANLDDGQGAVAANY